jgi:hypothetical protein
MKSLTPLCLIAGLVVIALTACQQQPDSDASSGPTATGSVANASTPVIPPPAPANASTADLPGDHADTRQYKIAIDLPTLPANEKPLADALRATVDHAKRDFLDALPDPKQLSELADRQFEMRLRFNVATNTPAFTSVRETGMQDTGGAHPIPVEAAFVFDRKAGKLITLDDLFTHPDAARTALANFAHDTLLKRLMAHAPKPGEGSPQAIREWKTNMTQMLGTGTRPTSTNYSVFVVRAGTAPDAASPGLTLVFPPYQVAAYVYGTQTVDVPASVFAKFLKPGYAGAFAP